MELIMKIKKILCRDFYATLRLKSSPANFVLMGYGRRPPLAEGCRSANDRDVQRWRGQMGGGRALSSLSDGQIGSRCSAVASEAGEGCATAMASPPSLKQS